MLKIKYVTDSASDIPKEFAKKHNIEVVAMPVQFPNGESFRDWYEITPPEFYEKLASSSDVPKTSQPSIVEIEEVFKKNLADHDAIIFVTISSNASGTFNLANMAKNNVLETNPDAKIEIVDSRAFSLFEVIMLEEGIKLQNEGKSLEEIIEGMKMRRRMTDVCAVVDTLKYLEKGGRINKASLIAGTLLDIKPVIAVRSGIIESIDKFRGSKTIIQKMIKKIKTMNVDEADPKFSIVHSRSEDRAEILTSTLGENFENSGINHISEIGAVIGTHVGPGTLAAFFNLKTPTKVYDED